MASKLKKRRGRRYCPSMPAHGGVIRRLPRPRVEIDRGLAWHCLWTAPRAERRVESALRERGLAAYTPVEAYAVVRRGKEVEVERPAVGRYVFVGLDGAQPQLEAVREALDGPCGWMIGIPALGRILLGPDGVPLIVPTGALQRFADGLEVVDRGSGRFAVGGAVIARKGPLASFRGIVESSDDYRVRALLNIFGRKTVVEFEPEQLEAAPFGLDLDRAFAEKMAYSVARGRLGLTRAANNGNR